MDQHDDHEEDEEEDDDPIRLLDVKNRDNIWTESDQDLILCDAIKSEGIQEELEDDSHNIDPYILKKHITNNLPLSFYSNPRNLHLLQNCQNFTIPIVNCDRYKKISVNGDTSIFSDNTKSTVNIKKDAVEAIVNGFDSNVILTDDQIDETENKKRNVATSGSKIILGSIKKNTSVLKPNSELTLIEKKSMGIDCRKNKGLVGIKVLKYRSEINNKEINKLKAKSVNAKIKFDRPNTNFTSDDSRTIGESVNKNSNSNVENELETIKLPDQTTISMYKTENDGVLIMTEKKNNESNRILTYQPNADLKNYNNKIITELERHDSTYITPSSLTDNSTRKKTSTKSENINKKEIKKRRIENLVEKIKYTRSINKSNGKTITKNFSKGLELRSPNIDTTLKTKAMIFDKSKLSLLKDNINYNMNSNFIMNKMGFNMKSNTEKLNIPPNSSINECTTIYKAVETENLHHSTNNNGELVLDQKMAYPNSVVDRNNKKSLESKYGFNTHNMLMHTERELDVRNNNSTKRQVANNEWKSTGIYHRLELPIQKQTVTKTTVAKFNQLRETTQININTNVYGKHGVYKENMHAIDNSVTNYQFNNSQSAVESSRSLKEMQTPVFATGIGSEIKNKPMDQKILIAKNVDRDKKKVVATNQNKKKDNNRQTRKRAEKSQKIYSNMHNQNFDNVPTNSNMTAPWPCRFNAEYNDRTLNTQYHHIEKEAEILKQRNELIRIHNKEIRNRAVDNRVAADNIIPQNANSVHNDATYSLMRNSLLNYNANIQKELDQTLNIQRQSHHTSAARNEIPRKVNAKRNSIPNSSRMCNRHANYNYNSNMTQLTQIKSMNSTKRFYNQNFTDNVVQQFQSTHPPQYRNLSDTKSCGCNYCLVKSHPSRYSGGNFVSIPKIPKIRTQCNNIKQQNYISQYHPMPNLMPHDSNSSTSHGNGYNMPLNLSISQLPDIPLQTPHFMDYSKLSPSVAPLMQSPISTLVSPLVKERVQTSLQTPVFPSITIPTPLPVHAQPPVPAPKPHVVLSPVPATVHSSLTISALKPATALGTATIETSLSTPTTEPKQTPLEATLPKPALLPEWSSLQPLQHLLPQLVGKPISPSTSVTAIVPVVEPMPESVPVPEFLLAPVPPVQPLKESQLRPHLLAPVASSVWTPLPPLTHGHGHGEKVSTDTLRDQKLEENIERKHKLDQDLEKSQTSLQPPVFPLITIPTPSPVYAQPPVPALKPHVVLSPVPATVHSSVTIPAPKSATALGTASIAKAVSVTTIEPVLTPVVATLSKPVQLPERKPLQSLQHTLPQLVGKPISPSTSVTALVPLPESAPVPALVFAPVKPMQRLKESQLRPHLLAPVASSVSPPLLPLAQHGHGHGEKVSTDTLRDQKLEENIERKHKLDQDLEKSQASLQPPVFPLITIPTPSPVHAQLPVQAPKPHVVLSPVPATIHSSVTKPASKPTTALGTASIATSVSVTTIEPVLTPVASTLSKSVQPPERKPLQSLQHILPQLAGKPISPSTSVTATVPVVEPVSGSVPVAEFVLAPVPPVQPLKESQLRPHLLAPVASSVWTPLPSLTHGHGHGEKVSTDTSDQKLEENIERKHKLEEDLEKIQTSVQPPVRAPKPQVVLSPVPATVHSTVTIPASKPATAPGTASIATTVSVPTIEPILTPVVRTLPKPVQPLERKPLQSLQHLLPQLVGKPISSSKSASVPTAEPVPESVSVPVLVLAPVPPVQSLKESQLRPHLLAPVASSVSPPLPPLAQHGHGHGEKVYTDTSDQKLEENIERKHKLEEDLEKIQTLVQPPVWAPKPQVVLSPVPATVHSSVTIPASKPATAPETASIATTVSVPTIEPILTPVVATLLKPVQPPERKPLQHLLPQLVEKPISQSTSVTASVPTAEPVPESVSVPALVLAPVPLVQSLKESQLRPHLLAPVASSVSPPLPPLAQHGHGHGEKVSTDTSDQKLEENIERKHKLEEDLEKIQTLVQPPVWAPKPQVVLSPVPATVHSSVTIPASKPATAPETASIATTVSVPTIEPILTPVVATLLKPVQPPERKPLQHLLPQLVEKPISQSTSVTASVPTAEPVPESVPVPALVLAPVPPVQSLKESQLRPHLLAPVASSVSQPMPQMAQHGHGHGEKVSTDKLSDQKLENNTESKHKLKEDLEKNGELKKKRISFEEYKKRRALLQLEHKNDNSKGCN